MLDIDLDLEADLGVDTVKQAEMFAAVRAAYNIPRDENMKLRDFPTLAHVIQFARERRPAAAKTTSLEQPRNDPVIERCCDCASPKPAAASRPRPVLAGFEAANKIPRRIPVPDLRPPLNVCKPTGVTLGQGSRVVLMADNGGVGDALAQTSPQPWCRGTAHRPDTRCRCPCRMPQTVAHRWAGAGCVLAACARSRRRTRDDDTRGLARGVACAREVAVRHHAHSVRADCRAGYLPGFGDSTRRTPWL